MSSSFGKDDETLHCLHFHDEEPEHLNEKRNHGPCRTFIQRGPRVSKLLSKPLHITYISHLLHMYKFMVHEWEEISLGVHTKRLQTGCLQLSIPRWSVVPTASTSQQLMLRHVRRVA